MLPKNMTPEQEAAFVAKVRARLAERDHAAYAEPARYVECVTQEHRDAAFRCRYAVHVEECGFLPADAYPDGLEHDEYDAVPGLTRMFAALPRENANGRVYGTVRVIRDPLNPELAGERAPNGITKLPVEQFLDLAPWRADGGRIEQVGSLAVYQEWRRRGVPDGLFKSVLLDYDRHRIAHMFIEANPSVKWLFAAIGFKEVLTTQAPLKPGVRGGAGVVVPIVVMHLDMRELTAEYRDYFRSTDESFVL